MHLPHAYDVLLGRMSTRALQLVGAAALARYCDVHTLSDPSIGALLLHLADLATTTDFVAWERRGSRLALTGRGDPMPASIAIAGDRRTEFAQLVQDVVEIGLCDAYGADTREPRAYARRALVAIGAADIALPNPSPLLAQTASVPKGLGPPIDAQTAACWTASWGEDWHAAP
jgi:hypothetical protein